MGFQVDTLAIDKDGVKWVTGYNDIGTMDWSRVYFYHYKITGLNKFDYFPQKMSEDFVNSICIDKDGNKWISYISKGLYVFNNDTCYSYDPQNSGLKSKWVSTIAVDKYGNVWIGEDGLTVYGRNGIISSTEKRMNDIKQYSLGQNYPNPFNPTTTISYSIPKESFVEMKVYDMLGREVSTFVSKEQSAGEYKVQFDGSALPSGVYIYTIRAGMFRESKKFMILK